MIEAGQKALVLNTGEFPKLWQIPVRRSLTVCLSALVILPLQVTLETRESPAAPLFVIASTRLEGKPELNLCARPSGSPTASRPTAPRSTSSALRSVVGLPWTSSRPP